MALDSMQEIFEKMQEGQKPFWKVVQDTDVEERQVTPEASFEKMRMTWKAMLETVDTYRGDIRSLSGLVGGDGQRMAEFAASGKALAGDYLSQVITLALCTAESNACMRKIVAAPTAGACGVLPAVLIPLYRQGVPEEEIEFTDGHLGTVRENLARTCGDFLLRRSDGMFAYQLAVVVDDAAMGVTEVVRGADLLDSTPRQLLLYTLLGWEAPSFYHLPLLLAPDGRRLSKRNADAGLEVLRGRVPAEEVLGKLGWLAGFHPSAAPCTAEALVEEFDWEKVPRTDIRLPEGLF